MYWTEHGPKDKKMRFEKEKDMHFCEFCTRANCKNCCDKTRAYPKAIPNKKGEVFRKLLSFFNTKS